MATLEDEIKYLKEKNNELAQKVQYWKMTAAERENEKLNLMKEMNELRLKLSRLRNTGCFEARKLDAALQQASENAISHLVNASAEIAKSMEIAKAYIQERQELDMQSPRWSLLGGTPATEKTDKVHRVLPMMMGGQSIQPVVSLSRTLLNTSNPRTGARSPNRSITERAVPMHMLQDVYIPLTRIDIADLPNNNVEIETEVNNESTEDLGLDDSEENLEESAQLSGDDEFSGRQLHALSEEDSEMGEDAETPRLTLHIDNPLEGPSWLLDSPPDSRSGNPNNGTNLEPDSTTELQKTPNTSFQNNEETPNDKSGVSVRVSCEFSPTVRRRKRTSSPPGAALSPRPQHYSPRPAARRSSTNRVLKVVVAKMRLDAASVPAKRARSPPRDLLSFDAPSPNGATDARVIVSEAHPFHKEIKTEPESRRESQDTQRSRLNSQEIHRNRPSQDTEEQRNRLTEEQRNRLTEEQDSIRNRLNTQDSHVRSRLLSNDRDSVQHSRLDSHDSRDSDSGSGGAGDSVREGRTRRPRKQVTYKEKPLNRKLRR